MCEMSERMAIRLEMIQFSQIARYSATNCSINTLILSSGFQSFASDISAIKTSIIDIAVEIADLKKCMKQQESNVLKSIVSTFESKESFTSFNAETEGDTEKFDKACFRDG